MNGSPARDASPQRGAWWGGALLFIAYLATLAPSVTLWDAGEFLSAIRTLGIPHPPGTPLFVLVAHAWASVVPFVPFTVAVNAASAIATVTACVLLGRLVDRWTSSSIAAFAATLVAGCMAAVWQSATETEVYAYAFALAAILVTVADRAGVEWSTRHQLLVAYLLGLAVPLHISALVAAPGIIYLAATDRGGAFSLRAALLPAGAFLIAAGFGTVSIALMAAGTMLLLAAALGSSAPSPSRPLANGALALAFVSLGASAVLFMLVRAQFDPGVNQGSPATWHALVEVVARRQYDVPPLWPRRAPLWLQLGNMIQYVDWQIASSLSDWPGASWRRTPWTLVFIALGFAGSVWHRRRDVRSWNGVALLLAGATVGVVIVLNLRAGPSYGFGVLPTDAIREARERDYFFSLAFALWGVWCGCGIAALCARRGRAAIALAIIPLALNWKANDRRRLPDARLSEFVGRALLQSAPQRAVLVMSGDNDSYAVWYAQRVLGERPDVLPVTIPLLAAEWYRAELARRGELLGARAVTEWIGVDATLAELSARARVAGRPLAAAVSVPPSNRRPMATAWSLGGMSYEAQLGGALTLLSVNRESTTQSAAFIDSLWRASGGPMQGAQDWTARYIESLLRCPSAALARRDVATSTLLETTCNYR